METIDTPTPEERIAALERRLTVIENFISEIGGSQKAFHDVIFSLLPHFGKIPELSVSIQKRLEESTAQNLGGSTNQAFFDGFDEAKAIILEALNEQ